MSSAETRAEEEERGASVRAERVCARAEEAREEEEEEELSAEGALDDEFTVELSEEDDADGVNDAEDAVVRVVRELEDGGVNTTSHMTFDTIVWYTSPITATRGSGISAGPI